MTPRIFTAEEALRLIELGRARLQEPEYLITRQAMYRWNSTTQCYEQMEEVPHDPEERPLTAPPIPDPLSVPTSRRSLERDERIRIYRASRYAGFWKRFAASVIDTIILGVGGGIVGFVFGFPMIGPGRVQVQDSAMMMVLIVANFILGVILGWVYSAVMESSPRQGTLGKMALSIKVVDLERQRISFGRATGRFFGKYLSGLILFIGFIMVVFTEKKQGLHDMMAGCLVIEKDDPYFNTQRYERVNMPALASTVVGLAVVFLIGIYVFFWKPMTSPPPDWSTVLRQKSPQHFYAYDDDEGWPLPKTGVGIEVLDCIKRNSAGPHTVPTPQQREAVLACAKEKAGVK